MQALQEHTHRVLKQEYRNCTLSIAAENDHFSGYAKTGEQLIGEGEDHSYEELLQKLRTLVDFHHLRRVQRRGSQEPTPLEYQHALKAIEIWFTPVQRQLLTAHTQAPDYCCQVDTLFKLTGIHSNLSLLLKYAAIARRLSDELAFIPHLNPPILDPMVTLLLTPTGILSAERRQTSTLQLHPIIGQTLEAMDGYRPVENISGSSANPPLWQGR